MSGLALDREVSVMGVFPDSTGFQCSCVQLFQEQTGLALDREALSGKRHGGASYSEAFQCSSVPTPAEELELWEG